VAYKQCIDVDHWMRTTNSKMYDVAQRNCRFQPKRVARTDELLLLLTVRITLKTVHELKRSKRL